MCDVVVTVSCLLYGVFVGIKTFIARVHVTLHSIWSMLARESNTRKQNTWMLNACFNRWTVFNLDFEMLCTWTLWWLRWCLTAFRLRNESKIKIVDGGKNNREKEKTIFIAGPLSIVIDFFIYNSVLVDSCTLTILPFKKILSEMLQHKNNRLKCDFSIVPKPNHLFGWLFYLCIVFVCIFVNFY